MFQSWIFCLDRSFFETFFILHCLGWSDSGAAKEIHELLAEWKSKGVKNLVFCTGDVHFPSVLSYDPFKKGWMSSSLLKLQHISQHRLFFLVLTVTCRAQPPCSPFSGSPSFYEFGCSPLAGLPLGPSPAGPSKALEPTVIYQDGRVLSHHSHFSLHSSNVLFILLFFSGTVPIMHMHIYQDHLLAQRQTVVSATSPSVRLASWLTG